MRIFSWAFLLILLQSCEKEPLPPRPPSPPPSPANPSKLTVLWQKPLVPDTNRYQFTGIPQVMVGGDIIYTVNWTVPTSTVQSRNGQTGELNWISANLEAPTDGFSQYGQVLGTTNLVLVHDWHDNYCLEPASGQKLWQDKTGPPGGGLPFASVHEGFLYTGHYSGQVPAASSVSIVRTPAHTPSWDTLITFYPKENFHPIPKPPALWVNAQGDTVIVIPVAGSHKAGTPLPPTQELLRPNLYAVNLRTRQLEWSLENFEHNASIQSPLPTIDGDRLYITLSKALFCIDLHTGQPLWRQPFEQGVLFCNPVVHQNIVVVQSDWHGTWGLDKFTGQILWSQPGTDGAAKELLYFDGIVYSTSTGYARLYAVDCATGKLIWAESSPNRKYKRTDDAGFDYSGVVIDSVRRVLYVADGYFLMCVKLPE